MTKEYKVWVEVEEIDHEASHYEKCGEPIDVAVFDTEGKALAFQELLTDLAETLMGHCPKA